MRYVQLPTHKQRREILWQTIDGAATALIAASVVSLFLQSLTAGLLLFVAAVASVFAYLVIEMQLEQINTKFSHHTHKHHPYIQDSRINALLWGMVIGGIAIGNFLLYFIRHGVSAAEIPTTAPLYKEAVILAGLTIIACLLTRIVHHRLHFTHQLHKSTGTPRARYVKTYALSFVYTITAVYLIILLSPYGANISFILPAIAIFVALREFQRFDRKHHRKALVELHAKSLRET